jgi:hypothetical protein
MFFLEREQLIDRLLVGRGRALRLRGLHVQEECVRAELICSELENVSSDESPGLKNPAEPRAAVVGRGRESHLGEECLKPIALDDGDLCGPTEVGRHELGETAFQWTERRVASTEHERQYADGPRRTRRRTAPAPRDRATWPRLVLLPRDDGQAFGDLILDAACSANP